MFTHYSELLDALENDARSTEDQGFRSDLLQLPLELWGRILWKSNGLEKYPRLLNRFPDLPPLETQATFVGGSGDALLPRNHDFLRVLESGVAGIRRAPLHGLRVLDYGCGWGRLTRYFIRHSAPGGLVAVDPNPAMIELLSASQFPADITKIEAVPNDPFPGKYDLIFLYSIFTHLPDWLVRHIMVMLRNSIADDGVVVFTTRPAEFWPYYFNATKDNRFEHGVERHWQDGNFFVPDSRIKSERPAYGDASFTAACLSSLMPDWQIERSELLAVDPFQVINFAIPV